MLLETNAFQSKPPSLEEGPMATQSEVENGGLSPIEKSTNYQRCMGFIKLILYLELIIFVGWIGCIYISNYYLYRPYNDDSTPHDQLNWKHDVPRDDTLLNGYPISTDDDVTRLYRNDESTPRNRMNGGDDFREDDSSATTQPMSKDDDIVTRFKEDIGAISNAERGQIPTTPVIPDTKDFIETVTPTESSSEKTTEASDEISLSGWSGILNIPPFEDDISEDNVEENDNSDKSYLDTFVDRIIFPDDSEYSASKVPESGLIHVIDHHFSDLNAAPRPKVDRPFPRLPSEESETIASTVTPKVEDDGSISFAIKFGKPVDPPSDELGSPEDDSEDYANSHMKEILFPVGFWNDYSQQSDADDDVVESSKESSPKDDVSDITTTEIFEDIIRHSMQPQS